VEGLLLSSIPSPRSFSGNLKKRWKARYILGEPRGHRDIKKKWELEARQIKNRNQLATGAHPRHPRIKQKLGFIGPEAGSRPALLEGNKKKTKEERVRGVDGG